MIIGQHESLWFCSNGFSVQTINMVYEEKDVNLKKKHKSKKPKTFHIATTEAEVFSSGTKYVNKTEEDITTNSKHGNEWNLP